MKPTIKFLNQLLADFQILAQKFHKAHWNVKCSGFAAFHDWLGSIYDELLGKSDFIAERIRQFDQLPIATYAEFIEESTLSEAGPDLTKQQEIIDTLYSDTESIITSINTALKEPMDEGTANYLADLLLYLEKLCWFLKSHKG